MVTAQVLFPTGAFTAVFTLLTTYVNHWPAVLRHAPTVFLAAWVTGT
ncbi:hypothetical protein ACFQMH_14080 [Streptomyces viridiviolaceus]|uniref:Uncharacterized protein n=1 Tax=Streptomyces viridiviolaceus TaxID=68282 RepID=A0ABW2E2W7_9ACTN|nr:hypothetical protein [Streptomyces viridiviolaceus]